MTARGALGRQKEQGRPAVILVTPVITAIGGITGGSGIQRNKGRRLDIPATHQRGSVACALLVLMMKAIPLVLWIPAFGENDGAGRPRPPEGAGTPRRHSRHPSHYSHRL